MGRLHWRLKIQTWFPWLLVSRTVKWPTLVPFEVFVRPVFQLGTLVVPPWSASLLAPRLKFRRVIVTILIRRSPRFTRVLLLLRAVVILVVLILPFLSLVVLFLVSYKT